MSLRPYVFNIAGYTTKTLVTLEVLVKAEHDFYREKWQKEKEKN